MNLKASYRVNKRDNETKVDSFTYFVNDSFGGITNSPATESNQPYSYDRRTAKLEAGYRVNSMARLNGEVSHETIERSPSEVRETRETGGKLRLRLVPLHNVQLALKAGASRRDGSDYLPVAGENLLLRKYNISDRDRVSGGVDLAYQPSDRLSLSANIETSDNDYDATRVGLTDARETRVTLDAAYQFSGDLSGHAFASHERYRSRQAGSQVPDTPDWFVQNEDTVNTLGMGFRWQRNERLEIGGEYVLSMSRGDTDMQSSNALPPVTPFPDVRSTLHALQLHADYRWRKQSRVRLTYRYEDLSVDDWALDGVAPDTIPEVLLLGEPNPGYSQHLVGIYVISEF